MTGSILAFFDDIGQNHCAEPCTLSHTVDAMLFYTNSTPIRCIFRGSGLLPTCVETFVTMLLDNAHGGRKPSV